MDALQCLFLEYHCPLTARVSGSMGLAQSSMDPLDVLQETYTEAYRTFPECRFAGPAPFYRWLETIALNRLKNEQRALRTQKRDVSRVQRRAASSFSDLLIRIPAPDTSPSQRAARRELADVVFASLARLKDEQRLVIRWRLIDELPMAEVAARLGKTLDAAYAFHRRAMSTLDAHVKRVQAYE